MTISQALTVRVGSIVRRKSDGLSGKVTAIICDELFIVRFDNKKRKYQNYKALALISQ